MIRWQSSRRRKIRRSSRLIQIGKDRAAQSPRAALAISAAIRRIPQCTALPRPTTCLEALPTIRPSQEVLSVRTKRRFLESTKIGFSDDAGGDPTHLIYQQNQCGAIVGNGTGSGICNCPIESRRRDFHWIDPRSFSGRSLEFPRAEPGSPAIPQVYQTRSAITSD